MKYEKGKWYKFTFKSECECTVEAIAKWLQQGFVIEEILRDMGGQMKINDPYWLPEEWFRNTVILCVTDAEPFSDVIKISSVEVDGYYVPITFIEEATEV